MSLHEIIHEYLQHQTRASGDRYLLDLARYAGLDRSLIKPIRACRSEQ